MFCQPKAMKVDETAGTGPPGEVFIRGQHESVPEAGVEECHEDFRLGGFRWFRRGENTGRFPPGQSLGQTLFIFLPERKAWGCFLLTIACLLRQASWRLDSGSSYFCFCYSFHLSNSSAPSPLLVIRIQERRDCLQADLEYYSVHPLLLRKGLLGGVPYLPT